MQPQQRRTFNRFFFGDEADKPDRSALPTPIDQFAKNYLGLRVSFARLSPDGSICGVTAYADTEYKITELGITRTLALKRNQVILDESFIRSGNVQRLCAKRRFTLAHECAHQILFQLESEEVKASCEMKYSARTAYTPRELKTREDWNEWQANVLGAAILLPQKEVDLAMRRFAETPLINYEGRYSYGDHLTLRLFCRLFGVSKTTASIRLRQLGYMVDRPFSEYVDPLEVWVMKRASIRVQEPTPELIEKIRRARVAISQQKPRYLKCPYCQHNAIAVYEDTRGHVESKCKKCGRDHSL